MALYNPARALVAALAIASAMIMAAITGGGAWASPINNSSQATRIFGELRRNALELGGTAALPLSLPSRTRVAFVAAPAGMAGLPGFPGGTVLRGNAQGRDILEIRVDRPDQFPGATGELNVLGLRAGTFTVSVVVLLVDGRKLIDRATVVVRVPGSVGAARSTTTTEIRGSQSRIDPNNFRSGFDLPAASGPAIPATFRSIPAALSIEMRGVKSLAEVSGKSPSYGVGRVQTRFNLGKDEEDPTGSFQLLAGYRQVAAALDPRAPRDLQGDYTLAPELGLGYGVGTWAFGLTAGPAFDLRSGLHARPAIISIAAENGDTASVVSIRSVELNTDFSDARFRLVAEYTPVRWGGFSTGLSGLVEGSAFSGAAKDGGSDIAAGLGPEVRLRTNVAGLPGELFLGGGPLWQGSGQGVSVTSHGGWRMWLRPQAATPAATASAPPAGDAL